VLGFRVVFLTTSSEDSEGTGYLWTLKVALSVAPIFEKKSVKP